MSIQIGTIAYKDKNEYAKALPLLTRKTDELKQATKNLLCFACEMFISDLISYCIGKNTKIYN